MLFLISVKMFLPLSSQAYLLKFYRDPNASKFRSRMMPDLEDELKAMQKFFGLEVTGKLDSNTLETMKLPRCGVTDVARYEHFQGRPRWKQSVVTYRFNSFILFPEIQPIRIDLVTLRKCVSSVQNATVN